MAEIVRHLLKSIIIIIIIIISLLLCRPTLNSVH